MEEGKNINNLLAELDHNISIFEKQKLKEQLTFYINHLLLNDFNKLIQLLYTIDVDEKKLKVLLQEQSQTDASLIITDLIIARQKEKRKAKNTFGKNQDIAPGEEW